MLRAACAARRESGAGLMKSDSISPIQKIAEELQLSPTTVSFVLNGRGDAMRISQKTQQRVREAAEKYHYRPNIYARRLRTCAGGVPAYGIAAFWNISYYVDEMLGALVRAVQRFEQENRVSIELVVQPYTGDHLCDFQECMTVNRYSGILLFGMTAQDVAFLQNHTFAVPIVVCNREIPRYSCVLNSDFLAGRMCAEHFFRRGITRAGILGIDPEHSAGCRRRDGFLEAAAQLGLLVRPEWQIEEPLRTTAGGYAAARKLLACGERPAACLCMYDTTMVGVLNACRERSLAVPQEMELVSCGDNVVLSYLSPSITSLCVPKALPMREALTLLLRAFSGELSEPGSIYCLPEWTYRESSPAPAP